MPKVSKKLYDEILSKLLNDLAGIASENENSIKVNTITDAVNFAFDMNGYNPKKIKDVTGKMTAEIISELSARNYVIL